MSATYWLVIVDRDTGEARTREIANREEAWATALDISKGAPELFTTVVRKEGGTTR